MTPPSTAVPAALVEEWVAAADEVDAFEVALSLAAKVSRDDEAELDRARLLLMVGRPGEALAVLARQHFVELPAEPGASWPYLLLAACRAAVGDDDAYRRLLSVVAMVPGRWEPLYLVGAAAEQRGDYGTADQAWTALVQVHHVVTRFTLARFLAGVLARRDRDDSRATLRAVVEEFLVRDPDLRTNPRPILAAAENLRRRGDHAGSALLLRAAGSRLPGVDALQATTIRRPAPLRWMHVPLLAVAAAIAVWCDLPPLVLAGLVPVLVVRGIAARSRVRGFSAADSAAWRAALRWRQGPTARSVDTEQMLVGGLVAAIVCTASVPIAGAFAGAVAGRPAAIARTVQYAAVSGLVFAALSVLLTGAGLGLLALARRHNWRTERRARQASDRYRLSDAGDCRCWRTTALTGSYAAAYLGRHLTPAMPGSALGRCPSTGALWLATTDEENGQLLLLRGADRPASDPSAQPKTANGYL
ncbi:tetratricopeptide repeat protein [Paractinoplanes maris]|uniref:tetratricopeptide repeat protein n=1 Tax=Paractinoplanes maris TaxID=1734446 RepID=UPI002021AC45|nr:hypothetical protein [Actinoplanes maris]